MRIMCLLAAVSLAGGLLGCGQKGPLLLPDVQHPRHKVGTAKAATPARSDPAAATSTPAPGGTNTADGTAAPGGTTPSSRPQP